MAIIEFAQKSMTREEFDKVRGLRGNDHGCHGTRKEYFALEELLPENAVCFRYDTDDDFDLSLGWARGIVRRKNLAKKAYKLELEYDRAKREIYILKRYLEKEDK